METAHPSIILMWIYVLAAFGLAYVMGHSLITRKAREWIATKHPLGMIVVLLIECPMCLGFWTGLIAAFIYYHSFFFSFVGAFYTSACNLILATYTKLIE